MDGNARTDRSSATRHYYVCKRGSRLSPDGSPACGKVSCSGVGLDQLIVELVMPRVIASTKAAALAHDLPNTARLMDIGDERSFLLTEHREGRLSAEAVFPAVAQLEAEAGLLRLEQERWLRSQGTARLAAGMTAKRWMGKEIEIGARRALVAEQISAVYVAGATRRTGSKFDHSRATPVWRDSFS